MKIYLIINFIKKRLKMASPVDDFRNTLFEALEYSNQANSDQVRTEIDRCIGTLMELYFSNEGSDQEQMKAIIGQRLNRLTTSPHATLQKVPQFLGVGQAIQEEPQEAPPAPAKQSQPPLPAKQSQPPLPIHIHETPGFVSTYQTAFKEEVPPNQETFIERAYDQNLDKQLNQNLSELFKNKKQDVTTFHITEVARAIAHEIDPHRENVIVSDLVKNKTALLIAAHALNIPSFQYMGYLGGGDKQYQLPQKDQDNEHPMAILSAACWNFSGYGCYQTEVCNQTAPHFYESKSQEVGFHDLDLPSERRKANETALKEYLKSNHFEILDSDSEKEAQYWIVMRNDDVNHVNWTHWMLDIKDPNGDAIGRFDTVPGCGIGVRFFDSEKQLEEGAGQNEYRVPIKELNLGQKAMLNEALPWLTTQSSQS